MKINKIIIYCILLTVFAGCAESYIEGINTSPNSPSKVQLANLISSAEVSVFGNVTGELARVTSIWMQSQAGLQDQSKSKQATYMALEGDNQNEWNSIYTGWLETADDLIQQAGDINPYYKGMGMVLKAWGGAYASDIWGDVPFSKALSGADDLHPAYDSQSAIYENLQTTLNEAITLFGKPKAQNLILPGKDDFIFEGDVEKWKKFAWMLKARYANRVSKKDQGSADKVLDYISKANLSGAEDNVYAKFGEEASNANQWFAFYKKRTGYMGMGKFLVDRLIANKDPRLAFYADTTSRDTYIGAPPDTRATTNPVSKIGKYLNKSSQPVPMVTYEEMKFLEAEAYLRKSNKTEAAKAYNDGVKSSVKTVTGQDAPADFIASNASFTANDITLEVIMLGKYDALFSQLEVWTDWRRLGIPKLTPNPDPVAAAKGIPHRFPTPMTERLYNTNAKIVHDNYAKLWFAN